MSFGFYRRDAATPLRAIQQDALLSEKLNQLTTLIGEQQVVIADFVKENKELRLSINKLESNFMALDTDVVKLKDEVSCPLHSKVSKAKGSKRLDSNLTVCTGSHTWLHTRLGNLVHLGG